MSSANNQLDCIPAELRDRAQWVTWKYSETKQKQPFDPHTGKMAKVNDLASWGTFDEASAAARRRHHAGIGYVFTGDDPYTGIDLDDCIDVAGGVAPWARTIVETLQTYTEISPSGTGLKLWVEGSIPQSLKTPQLEMYSERRYFTVTGQQLAGTPDTIRAGGSDLETLYRSLRPEPAPVPTSLLPAGLAGIDDDHARHWCVAALEGEQRKMLAAGEGERHNRRYDSAYALAGLIHTGGLTEQEITAALAVNFGPDAHGAMKTIADGIAAGRQAPREIPSPKERDVGGFHFSTAITEETIVDNPEAEHWRLVAQYWQEQAEMLEGWRAWAMGVAAIPSERLSPAAKVTALTLWPEMQSRAEQGITEPKRILIEEASTKTGLSSGTHGSKLKELAAVGAIERIEARQENGHKKILIQPTTLWATPADWQPEAPRTHGGAADRCAQRPVKECPGPACGPETPVIQETQTATRYLCGDCKTPLGHRYGKVHRHTWRPNPQDAGWGIEAANEADPNPQLALIEEDGSSPIKQVEGWLPPTRLPYLPPEALMDPSETLGVQRRTIAADDPWFALQQELATRQALGGTSP